MSFKFKITIPKPNLKWYNDSKSELLKITEEHNKQSWSREQDPVTGRKWEPRKQPTGSHPLLRKSGKMMNTTKFKAGSSPMDFSARTNVNYGGFHQKGTSKMVQRRWLGIGSNIVSKYAPVFRKRLFKGKYEFSA